MSLTNDILARSDIALQIYWLLVILRRGEGSLDRGARAIPSLLGAFWACDGKNSLPVVRKIFGGNALG